MSSDRGFDAISERRGLGPAFGQRLAVCLGLVPGGGGGPGWSLRQKHSRGAVLVGGGGRIGGAGAASIGQCAVEGDGFTANAENLRYTHAERICAVWPSRFPDVASATPFVNNPPKLANRVYANRMGNGPPESGDGWRFRGLGLIQITGREEYTAFAASVGRTVEDAAAWAATPDGAAASACWFWTWKNLNPIADLWALTDLTRRINGGTIGLPDRITACNAALAALA